MMKSEIILLVTIQLFFSTESPQSSVDFSVIDSVIPSLVTDVENANLIKVPSFDEIKDTIFSMDPNSAPGPDGFTCKFFQHCWDIVGRDVSLAVQEFFSHWCDFFGSQF